MTTEDRLRGLEAQGHCQRVGAMIALRRQRDAESQAIIAALEHGGFYERMLALYNCFSSRDAAHVLRELNDLLRLLRGRAAQLAAHICDDVEALCALEDAPPFRTAGG